MEYSLGKIPFKENKKKRSNTIASIKFEFFDIVTLFLYKNVFIHYAY